MDKIHIVVGNPDNPLKKEYMFIEYIAPLYYYLKDNNYNVNIIWKGIDVDSNNNNLHIGVFNAVTNLPKNYIMANLEPPCNRDMNYNKKLCGAKAILNFHDVYNVFPKESSHYNKNIIFPMPTYHPVLENLFNVNENNYKTDIDVLFYGTMTQRRINIYNEVKKAGINIYCPNRPISNDYPHNVFGKEKDVLIARSKIILIINAYNEGIDYNRTIYCLSKKKCIIAESSDQSIMLKEEFDNKFPVVEIKDIVNTIKYYLKNDKERNELAEKGYEYIKEKYKIENYIDPILKIINQN